MEIEINQLVADYIEGKIDSKELSDKMKKFDNSDVFDVLQHTNSELITVIDVASDLSYCEQQYPESDNDLVLRDYYHKNLK